MAKKEEAPIKGLELISEVQRMELKAGDVIVCRTEAPIREEYRIFLQKQLRRLFQGHQVIVLDGPFDLMTINKADLEVAAEE